MVRKKYRKEKGTRERLWCSKPHSKDDISSRINGDFSEISNPTIFNKKTKTNLTNRIKLNKNI